MSFICYFFIVAIIQLKYVLPLFLFSVTKVMEKYLVPDYANVQEFLAHLGKRLGKLKKGKLFVRRNNELCKSGLCCSKADNTKQRLQFHVHRCFCISLDKF